MSLTGKTRPHIAAGIKTQEPLISSTLGPDDIQRASFDQVI
jgi:hypothetical protein